MSLKFKEIPGYVQAFLTLAAIVGSLIWFLSAQSAATATLSSKLDRISGNELVHIQSGLKDVSVSLIKIEDQLISMDERLSKVEERLENSGIR